MKSLVEHINEALINESKSVCGLCPTFDGSNEKEFKKILEPIFKKLKNGADKYAYLAGDVYAMGDREAVESPDLAAVIKAAMDFLIRNLSNIKDDCEDTGNNDNFRGKMLELFDGDFNDYFEDEVYDYCDDFDDYGVDLSDYTDMLANNFNTYCKKVVHMDWY